MEEVVLVAKKDVQSEKMNITLNPQRLRGRNNRSYFKAVHLRDFKDLALFFSDLHILFNAPIEKAYHQFKEHQADPFWS